MKNLNKNKKRVEVIIKKLKELFPTTRTALSYSNPLELLIAVILSAQTTDKRVNIVTEKLFSKYKNIKDYIKADLKDFENDIHSVNFFRNKAKNILATAKIIQDKFSGKVPQTMEELLILPGVARKTANVVLGVAFNKNEGVVVDTHVRRLANTFRLTDSDDPKKIEEDLMAIVERDEWRDFSLRLIDYGRRYCVAIKHDHANCPLTKILK